MSARPDPDTGALDALTRELAGLVSRYRVASHLVGEQSVRPDDIDDETLAWWIAAHRAVWRRRFEIDTTPPARPRDEVVLRRERLRDPRH